MKNMTYGPESHFGYKLYPPCEGGKKLDPRVERFIERLYFGRIAGHHCIYCGCASEKEGRGDSRIVQWKLWILIEALKYANYAPQEIIELLGLAPLPRFHRYSPKPFEECTEQDILDDTWVTDRCRMPDDIISRVREKFPDVAVEFE